MQTIRKPAKPAKRKGRSLSQKLKIARLATVYGKTVECAAQIMGICARQARRDYEYILHLSETECAKSFVHWLHAHDMGFCNPECKEDYLKRDEDLRA